MIDKIQKYQPLRTLFFAFAVVASLLTICIAGCELIMERVLCDFDVQREIVSPSNKLKIVVFDYGCGVGSDANTQVSVMPNSKPFSVWSYPSFFHVSGQHQLYIVWETEQLVSIKPPERAVVNRQDQPTQVQVNYIH